MMGVVAILCIPPWRQAVFTDFVAKRSETDAEHLGSKGPVSVGKGESFFEVKFFNLPDGSPCRGAHDGRRRLRSAGLRDARASVKLHFEAGCVDFGRLA